MEYFRNVCAETKKIESEKKLFQSLTDFELLKSIRIKQTFENLDFQCQGILSSRLI